MPPSLTATIRSAIRASDRKPHDLALSAGVSPPQLYRFLSGERGLSLDVLDKVAGVLKLGITIDGQPFLPPEAAPNKNLDAD